MENFFHFGNGVLCDVIMGTCFHPCGRVFLAFGVNPTNYFWLKFYLESRLSSKSLETLIGLLAYMEPKL